MREGSRAPLPARTRFFWRVTARSVQGIGWATPPQGPFEVPSWVRLDVLNDPGGTQVADAQPEFRWTAMDLPGVAGPFVFELQILSDREGELLQSYPGLAEEHHKIADPLPFNLPLRWRVIAKASAGLADTVASAGPFVVTGGANPPVTLLYQNFPNPFPDPDGGVRETRIWFDLARTSVVELAVYDMRGRMVRSLIPAQGCGPTELPPGLYGQGRGAVLRSPAPPSPGMVRTNGVSGCLLASTFCAFEPVGSWGFVEWSTGREGVGVGPARIPREVPTLLSEIGSVGPVLTGWDGPGVDWTGGHRGGPGVPGPMISP